MVAITNYPAHVITDRGNGVAVEEVSIIYISIDAA